MKNVELRKVSPFKRTSWLKAGRGDITMIESRHDDKVKTHSTRASYKRVADDPPARTEVRCPRLEDKGPDVGGGACASSSRLRAAPSPETVPVDPTDAPRLTKFSSERDKHEYDINMSRGLLSEVVPEPTLRDAGKRARIETTTLVHLEAMFDGAKNGNGPHVTSMTEPLADKVTLSEAPTKFSAFPGEGAWTAMIRGLPKNWSERDFSKWLDKRVVSRTTCKKKKSWPYGFVTFAYLNDRLIGTSAMEGCRVEGRVVSVHEATTQKAGLSGAGLSACPGGDTTARTREDLNVFAADRGRRRDVRDAVCPLWNIPYARQLSIKRENVKKALQQLTRTVVRNGKRAKRHAHGDWRWPPWIAQANARSKMAVSLEGIVRSPVLEGYRNKSEFTIGFDADGHPTVGFNVGLFKEGVTAVASPEKCCHISSVAKNIAATLQSHLRAQSNARDPLTLPVWDKHRGAGFWRLLIVREGGLASDTGEWSKWKLDITTDALGEKAVEIPLNATRDASLAYPKNEASAEIMVVVQVSPEGFDPEKTRTALACLAGVLRNSVSSSPTPFTITHALAQIHQGVSNAAAADAQLLDLTTYETVDPSKHVIHERLCGLRFSLSATAFFQVNTCAAEVLYRLAGEWASPTGNSLLLDICCGTGTIGLTLASRVKKVIGVDIVSAAVKDAKANAELNGVENCEWIEGKAEEKLPEILTRYAPFIAPAAPEVSLKCPHNLNDNGEMSGEDLDDTNVELLSSSSKSKVDAEQTKYEYEDVVAIVDPPRAGLHKSVLRALRQETRLRRLVYVSCNPETMAANCAELCTPHGPNGDSAGRPFQPIRAIAVDLFPHTMHCEAVLLLER